MARAATTSDVFNAVAEPRRRRILALLEDGTRSVNELASALRVRQPQASKHLRVLKEVGLVSVRDAGQQRLYSLNEDALLPIRDWVLSFRRLREESFDRLDRHLKDLQAKDQER